MNNLFKDGLSNWINSSSYDEWVKNTDALAKETNAQGFISVETKDACSKLFKKAIAKDKTTKTWGSLPCLKWAFISKDRSSLDPLLLKLKNMFLYPKHNLDEVLSEMLDPDCLIIKAIQEGDLDAIQEMASFKVDFNRWDDPNRAPLFWAAVLGNQDILSCLLENGADPNMVGEDGITVLMRAIDNGHVDCVKALLESGKVDINQTDKDGQHALFLACACGSEEMLNLLLDHHIDINLQDKMGATALTNLILYNHAEVNKKFFEVLAAKIDSKSLFMHKEIVRLISVAHSANIAGVAQIKVAGKNYTPIELEGAWPEYWLKKMCKVTEALSIKAPEIFTRNVTEELMQLLNSGLAASSKDLFERHKQGLPILLNTGYQGHTVSVLIWKDCFVLCNRGEGARRVSEAYCFDAEALNETVLSKITGLIDSNKEAYEEFIFKDLPDSLKFQPREEWLEEACYLAPQTSGNCSWAATELAVLAFLLLHELDDSQTLLEENKVREIKAKLNEWLGLNQMYHLERYLGSRWLRPSNSEKDKNAKEGRKEYAVDSRVFLTAMQSIIQTMPKKSENTGHLNHILARAMPFDENDACMNFLEAKKLIKALFEPDAEEVLERFIEKMKPEEDSSGLNAL